MERATMPGGALEGEPFEFYVYTPVGQRSQPAMIEYVSSGGVLVRTELSHYRSASGGRAGSSWPRSVVVSSYNEQGKLAAHLSVQIMSLVIDEEIDPARFTIDPARADRTWSESLGLFID